VTITCYRVVDSAIAVFVVSSSKEHIVASAIHSERSIFTDVLRKLDFDSMFTTSELTPVSTLASLLRSSHLKCNF